MLLKDARHVVHALFLELRLAAFDEIAQASPFSPSRSS